MEYAQKTYRQFVAEPVASYGIGGNEPLQQLVGADHVLKLDDLLAQLKDELASQQTEIEETE